MNTGPRIVDNSCLFSVWAPEKENILLHIIHPSDQEIPMTKDDEGYFSAEVKAVGEGCRYFYRIDGKDMPDPASHFQPEGVHGPSQVVDHEKVRWNDFSWKGIPLKDLIFYEVHTGTFTNEGTLEAIIPFLDELSDTGINALQLMPVCQFSGSRNWGYDGVFPYSVHNIYGGPEGLKKLVDASHARGISVFLDVVYNHIGPEGNYFRMYGPYFTDRYKVPWGDAINFDDAWSDGVREYFSCNPCHWFGNYHVDGLRVDAIHMMYDNGAVNFWQLASEKVRQMESVMGRRFYLVAESDFNSPKVVKPAVMGGLDFDAQWLDDFHHALYVLLDTNGKSRYEDFGSMEQLAKAYTDGFVYSGEYVRFRKRRHGSSSAGIPCEKFVVFNQNHDQVGNRVLGERLPALVSFERLKIAAAAVLLSPYIPLLFMGEDYGEDNPFFYFVSHTDEDLVRAVKEGRKKEFADYKWNTEPPDPQDESTFTRSKISWGKRYSGNYRLLLEWTKQLISLRRSRPAFKNRSHDGIHFYVVDDTGFIISRKSENEQEHILSFFNLSDEIKEFHVSSSSVSWKKLLDSSEGSWSPASGPRMSVPPEIKGGDALIIPAASVVVYCNN